MLDSSDMKSSDNWENFSLSSHQDVSFFAAVQTTASSNHNAVAMIVFSYEIKTYPLFTRPNPSAFTLISYSLDL